MIKLQKGVTIIEVLIYISLTALIGVILLQIISQFGSLFFTQNSTIKQGVAINDTLSQITDQIKQTNAVASSVVDGANTYTTGSNTIVLSLPSIDTSGGIIASKYDYAVFTPDSQKTHLLKKIIIADALSSRKDQNSVLLNTLDTLQFYYQDASGQSVTPTAATRISIVLNLKEYNGLEYKTSSASSTINLKNN